MQAEAEPSDVLDCVEQGGKHGFHRLIRTPCSSCFSHCILRKPVGHERQLAAHAAHLSTPEKQLRKRRLTRRPSRTPSKNWKPAREPWKHRLSTLATRSPIRSLSSSCKSGRVRELVALFFPIRTQLQVRPCIPYLQQGGFRGMCRPSQEQLSSS